MIHIREAVDEDAEDMAEVQNAIHRAGLRPGPVDAALVRERYLAKDYRVACTAAASIGSDNSPALAYYAAMGFVPDHGRGDAIAYRLDL